MIPKYGTLDPFPSIAEEPSHPSAPDVVDLLDRARRIPASVAQSFHVIAADPRTDAGEKAAAFAAAIRVARHAVTVLHTEIGTLSAATSAHPRDAAATHRLQSLDGITRTLGELVTPYLDRAERGPVPDWIPFTLNTRWHHG